VARAQARETTWHDETRLRDETRTWFEREMGSLE
jgi:hypothetical protein